MLEHSAPSCVSASTSLARGCGHLWQAQLDLIVWPDLSHGIPVSFSQCAAEFSDSVVAEHNIIPRIFGINLTLTQVIKK